MQTVSPHLNRSTVLVALAGVVLAGVVYLATADVIWTLVALLLTFAAVRRLLRRGHTS